MFLQNGTGLFFLFFCQARATRVIRTPASGSFKLFTLCGHQVLIRARPLKAFEKRTKRTRRISTNGNRGGGGGGSVASGSSETAIRREKDISTIAELFEEVKDV